MDSSADPAVAVPALLAHMRGVTSVELCGSRRRGDAGRFSDWDFAVRTDDVAATAADLPEAVRSLHPLAAQWDRLSDEASFMFIVPGPVKVDLIFTGVPHAHEPPWTVTASTIAGVDAHFWDWTLWLASKVDADRTDLVRSELDKMHEHILGPLGRPRPESVPDAVDSYLAARDAWERDLDVSLDRSLGREVGAIIDHLRP